MKTAEELQAIYDTAWNELEDLDTPPSVTERAAIRAVYDAGRADRPTEAWVDKHGDAWTQGDDGLMHAYETAPFPREHVEKKWGPLKKIRLEYAPEPSRSTQPEGILT